MKTPDQKLQEWLYRYDIMMKDTGVRRQIYYSPKMDYGFHENANSKIDLKINTYSEPVYSLTIGKRALEEIVNTESKILDGLKSGDRDYCEYLMKKETAERKKESAEVEVRKNNPAVKKAYEQYIMLLKMASLN